MALEANLSPYFRATCITECRVLGWVLFFSDVLNINFGATQGCILGPLLFLFHINELPKVSELLSSVLFIDDATLFASGSDYNDLVDMFNVELEKVSFGQRQMHCL